MDESSSQHSVWRPDRYTEGMGDDTDWSDARVEDDMPTAQSAPSEAAAAARAVLNARKQPPTAPPPADADDDSEEEGAAPAAPPEPTRSSCRHSVAVPPDWTGDRTALDAPSYDGERAKTYPFVLDAFQETSVSVLERNESVLVAAHTSAGKTVVAEYAIAMAFRDKQRVVYTSPLKALSNQKFRELTEEFGDVGLMTGDVCINPNASCIVMTTEVLRGMLYRGSDVVREVKWIIFDEVHYMRDRERGVVWEESIVFAPSGCKFVFLSATLPNAHEFAEWITHLHAHPCHVVYTDYRPTPLQHYAFPKGGNGLHLIVNERKEFQESNFATLQAALDEIQQSAKKRKRDEKANGGRGGRGGGRGGGRFGGRFGGRGGRGGDSGEDASEDDIMKIMKTIRARSWFPVIVFSFSRRQCEEHAKALTKGKTQLDFTTTEQKEVIKQIYDNALLCMAEEDRDLECVREIYPFLERGIGIHHGGLLPIIKELVEILFGESLVKCLFATETFAMGLNMPARTCVFTDFEKFDGVEMRTLQPGEYTQMAGRAGRRGKDDRGTCILMLDKKVDKEELTNMTCGEGHALKSEFKLTYYGILNLMRKASGEEDAEYVIQRSFHQFQHTRDVPRKQAELAECQTELDGIQLDMSDAKAELVRLQNGVRDCRTKLMHHVIDPEKLTKDVLKPGRLVRVRDGDDEWGWGVLVGTRELPPSAVKPLDPNLAAEWGEESEHGRREMRIRRLALDVLIHCGPGVHTEGGVLRPARRVLGRPGKFAEKGCACEIIPVALRLVDAVGAMVLTLPKDLTDEGAKTQVGLAVNELHHRFQGKSIPELDFENDLGLGGDEFHDAMGTWLKAESDLKSHALYAASIKDGGLNEAQIATYRAKASLMERAVALKKEIKTTQLSKFREELRHRSRVLCKFGMLTEDGIVTRKGRAACEIDTADELLVTELMFNGCFVAMDHHALVALCAMFMPVEKTKEVKSLTGAAKEALDPAVKQLRETARAIAEAEIEFGVRTAVNDGEDGRHEAVNEYVDSFKDALVGVVYNWSKGTHFDEIMRDTDLFEGTVVRCMRRLDELMMELHRAARAVGSEELAVTFEKGAESLRHGVVSAASLYL